MHHNFGARSLRPELGCWEIRYQLEGYKHLFYALHHDTAGAEEKRCGEATMLRMQADTTYISRRVLDGSVI